MNQSTDQSPPHFFSRGTALAAVAASSGVLLIARILLSPDDMILDVGLLMGMLLGFVLLLPRVTPPQIELPPELDLPFRLAHDEPIYLRYHRITELLLKISRHSDPIFRAIALEQLDELTRRITTIAASSLVFEETETWRIIYERLLRCPGLYLYRSVAWVRNADYWQDEPGRKSMAVNFELAANHQLNIERVVIIADELWPLLNRWPAEPIRRWLHEQHAHGIVVQLVRESALKQEPELLADVGIYGSRALGTQELDDQGRTARFVLTFDYTKVTEAEDRWNRLAIYAESYEAHLDRFDFSR